MGVTRFFAAFALMAVPAGVVAQEPTAEFSTPPGSASAGTRSVFLTLADLEGTRGTPVRIVIPAGTFGLSSDQALEQSAAQRRWQTVDAWPPGEHIIITLGRGDVVEGAFKYATSEELFLTGPTGGERRIPKAEVRQIKGVKKDTSVDGLLLGAAVGTGFGVLIGYDRRTLECRTGCSIAIGTTLFTPIGALVGWLRDRKRNHTEILYNDAP
jgi:hypothetical protein